MPYKDLLRVVYTLQGIQTIVYRKKYITVYIPHKV